MDIDNTTATPLDNGPVKPGNEEKEIKSFFQLFASHLKKAFDFFSTKKKNGRLSNADFVAYGRTDEERDMIAEACESIDKQYELLQEVRTSGLSPEEWLTKKSMEIFADCSDDEVEVIQDALNQDAQEEIEAQAEAFEEMADSLTSEEKEANL